MYSLIGKITHSNNIKDAISIFRGIYRVVSSDSSAESHNRDNWMVPQPQSTVKASPPILRIITPTVLTSEPQTMEQFSSKDQYQRSFVSELREEATSSQPKADFNKVNSQNSRATNENIEWSGALQGIQHKESKVISSRLGRFFEYGKLGGKLVGMEIQAYVARNLGRDVIQIYEKGAQSITDELCKMRGAPLKVIQMLSIQQENLIPTPIRRAFQKAREQAHIMPDQEVSEAMAAALGKDWRQKFGSFEMKPFAAASIGQVHRATSKIGQQIAVKLQYPGVQKSIDSDIRNLKFLLKMPGVLPTGIFIDKLLANTQKELTQQCDYVREANMQDLYTKCLKQVMGNEFERFGIPQIVSELSGKTVLTSQFLRGAGLSKYEDNGVPQIIRDEVGRLLMKLTFSQIFQMGIMQSDPNPSNFTYDSISNRLNLFDFGATHIYAKPFMQSYCGIINASVKNDHPEIIEKSIQAGFLTREENQIMLDKHVESILALGEPLRYEGVFDFGSQDITSKIYRTIPLMLKNRLKSPPEEVYSLHRKLSGAYLACIRMRARVDCRAIFQQLKPAYRIESLL